MKNIFKNIALIAFASIIVMLNGCSHADKSTEKPEITDSVLAPVITNAPTSESTMKPTNAPITVPTIEPTDAPITVPTIEPTNAPIDESDEPIVELDKNVEEGIKLDASLAYAIRKELGIDEKHIITYEELESITYLAAFDKPVASLKGISLLKNLTEFHVTSGTIDNIEELCQLSKMRFIDISNCYISEIPDLSACTELESLYLIGNKIKDISPVNKIKSLRSLNLDCNFINSIKSIKDLTNLEMLIIGKIVY
ncbi:MAG: leucine-rich repeat domain-containing protein [Lachnospiraceae bacterium]|nr:leucine-rich repeat domain-containing protein [Lachnospiraceae bacterium]